MKSRVRIATWQVKSVRTARTMQWSDASDNSLRMRLSNGRNAAAGR